MKTEILQRRTLLSLGLKTSTLCLVLVPASLQAQNPRTLPWEELRGIHFRLEGLTYQGTQISLPERPGTTLQFLSEGYLGGKAPVNLYFGSFETLPGEGIRWHRAGIGSTMMAGPLELMELERVYFSALMESSRLSLEGGGMIMQSADGRTQLKFVRLSGDQPVAQHFDKPLELVRLIVSGEEVALPSTGRPRMTISQSGLVNGFAGINQFMGSVRIRPDNSVLPGPFASTRKAGPPELMAVEDAFLRAFGLVRKVRSAESGLTFTSEDSSYSLEFETR